jgi:hypothetical protein
MAVPLLRFLKRRCRLQVLFFRVSFKRLHRPLGAVNLVLHVFGTICCLLNVFRKANSILSVDNIEYVNFTARLTQIAYYSGDAKNLRPRMFDAGL